MADPLVNSAEQERLEVLRQLKLLRLGRLPEMDRLSELLARSMGFPMAAVTVVEEGEVEIVGAFGALELSRIPRCAAFCDRVIAEPKGWAVGDTLMNEETSSNPFVVGAPHIRAVTGVPIIGRGGHAYGAICLLDLVPHETTELEIQVLRLAAEAAALAMDNHHRSHALERGRADLLAFEADLKNLAESTALGLFKLDEWGRVAVFNASACRICGIDPDCSQGMKAEILVDPSESYRIRRGAFQVMCGRAKSFSTEVKLRSPSPLMRYGRIHLAPIEEDQEGIVGLYGTIEDVSESYELQKKSDELLERLQKIADHLPGFIYQFKIEAGGKMTFPYSSPRIQDIYGCSPEIAAQDAQVVIDRLHPDDLERVMDSIRISRESLTPWECEYRVRHPDKGEIWVRGASTPELLEDGSILWHGFIVDVSDQRALMDSLEYQAKHDSLTGALSRKEFESQLAKALDDCGDNEACALAYLDLDQFKVVNDQCGHAAGDSVLNSLVGALKSVLRNSDRIGRIGGDEFAVILRRSDWDDVLKTAREMVACAKELTHRGDDGEFHIGISLGLAPISRGMSVGEALRGADSACYAAKQAGRGRVKVHDPDTEETGKLRQDLDMRAQILRAVDEGSFVLYGQLISPAAAARRDKCEVLIRMRQPDGTILPPGAFLPVAEKYGLATAIDRWVVKEALQLIQRRGDMFDRVSQLAINLSGQSLGDADFHSYVEELLAGCRFSLDRICFEITETYAVDNQLSAQRFIQRMAQRGIKIALDDFGSGASSFGYLKTFTINYIKIDGLFIKKILEDDFDRMTVRHIVEMARLLGLRTVAEFVETEEARRLLVDLGVDYVQGYLIHKPEPIEQIFSTPLRMAA
jgi:diguanylate cyclase (GGDEF)-like protein/PAS domain S-box-containing protein